MVYPVILLCFLIHLTCALKRFYMEEECGGTIAMEHGSYGYIPAGRLAVTRRSKYRSTFSCHVTIVAPEPERLIIVFRELDIELEPNCDDDFVQFFDGRTRSAPIVRGLRPRICGHKPPVGNYVTTGNALTVYFQSDVFKQENGFEIVFTAFHTGQMCHKDEFRCSNGRCIAKSLECDDFNNCGDYSDECKVGSETLVAVIISVFLVTIIATGVVSIIRKKQKKSKLNKAKETIAKALSFSSTFGKVSFNKHGGDVENQPVLTVKREVQPSVSNLALTTHNGNRDNQSSVFVLGHQEMPQQKFTQTSAEELADSSYSENYSKNVFDLCVQNQAFPLEKRLCCARRTL